jgi:uncharacterized protein (DUF1778 family)
VDGTYDLGALGWLLFERLCETLLAVEMAVDPRTWSGAADTLRSVDVGGELRLPDGQVVPGPVRAIAARLHGDEIGAEDALLLRRLGGAAVGPFGRPRTLLVLTNARATAGSATPGVETVDRHRLGRWVEGSPATVLRFPAVLGVREPARFEGENVERSSLDRAAAWELARVFAPTRAYARAADVLERHRFAVLTGPPEMGKTAAARMVALARLQAGWEAHEFTRPDELWGAFDPARRQLFVADDAFGSTEYRPDAAERWARALPGILRALDERHWLIWTSRPAPLRAGLHRVRQERGTERFPSPAEVHVDAAALDTDEKALILLRHAKAAALSEDARELVRAHGPQLVEHEHFTPERIRRFVATRLRALADAPPAAVRGAIEVEMATPTEAMAASLRALDDEHRDLLVAMLDVPPGPVEERSLAAAMRRHHAEGLPKPPTELLDRLTDHFVRVL